MSRRVLFTLSTVLLFCGFCWNTWRVADTRWLEGFKRGGESHILGRLAMSSREGVFSAGGLTGIVADCAGPPGAKPRGADSWICRDPVRPAFHGPIRVRELRDEWPSRELTDFQYSAYGQTLHFDVFSPYMSQIGGQGMAFSVLDRLLPVTPGARFKTFRALTALLTALAVSLIVRWFQAEFGIGVAAFALASGVSSKWLTGFARNLWWSTWAFYLPMIAVMIFLERARVNDRRFHAKLGTVAFAAVLVKCLANGYEYLTTTLVMMLVPLVYSFYVHRAGFRAICAGFLAAVTGGAVALACGFALLSFQISSVRGGWSSGFEHVRSVFLARTHGDPAELPEMFRENLNAATLDVVTRYFGGAFLDLGSPSRSSPGERPKRPIAVGYGFLATVFAAASIVVALGRTGRRAPEFRRRDLGLVLALWFSILAPLSWFVVFKAHSSSHYHLNFIVWQMPFTFFGFATCGLVVQRHLFERWRGRSAARPAEAGAR